MRAPWIALGSIVACGSPTVPPPATPEPAPTPEPTVDEPPPVAPPTSLLERVGDVALVQLDADGFGSLPLAERTFAYHLARASIAGDRIAYDQRYRHNLAIKDLCEGILTHADGVDPAVIEPLRAYTKALWIHHGVHNGITSRKFVPTFSFEALAAAATRARANGAALLGAADDAALAARLEELRRPIFDADFEAFSVQKTPPAGQDILAASANNFYSGVTLADLRGFRERFVLNSRLVKRGRRVVEEPYRAGAEGVPPGLYAAELGRVLGHLRRALPLATEAQRAYLQRLARWFETGDAEEFRAYNIGWVADDPPVDAILGFIESYGDPRGGKGTWEGIVSFVDRDRTAMMRRIAENARYFEERTPWRAEYRRSEFRPLVANAVTVVVETGDGGPLSAAGINLPNEQAIRERHGSRNYFLSNVTEASDRAVGAAASGEFAWSPEEGAEIARCSPAIWDAIVALHEVTGHASGAVSPRLRGDPHTHLREYYSTLEEARADLVALWHLGDPKVVELGVLPDAACQAAAYRAFASSHLLGLRKIPEGDTIEEDHMRARALIVGWGMEKGAIVASQRDGHFFLRVPDPAPLRAAWGELLAELQRIKAEGDRDAIAALVERHATRLDPAWRDDAVLRAREIGLAAFFAFVSPRLVATRDASGAIADVQALRPESFEALQLEWSRIGIED
jgi:dipeptidyl-peptidase-3